MFVNFLWFPWKPALYFPLAQELTCLVALQAALGDVTHTKVGLLQSLKSSLPICFDTMPRGPIITSQAYNRMRIANSQKVWRTNGDK